MGILTEGLDAIIDGRATWNGGWETGIAVRVFGEAINYMMRSEARPLFKPERMAMEPFFNKTTGYVVNFDKVRIHEGYVPADPFMLRAKAQTIGHHIYFRNPLNLFLKDEARSLFGGDLGQYHGQAIDHVRGQLVAQRESAARLFAHELVHVAQGDNYAKAAILAAEYGSDFLAGQFDMHPGQGTDVDEPTNAFKVEAEREAYDYVDVIKIKLIQNYGMLYDNYAVDPTDIIDLIMGVKRPDDDEEPQLPLRSANLENWNWLLHS